MNFRCWYLSPSIQVRFDQVPIMLSMYFIVSQPVGCPVCTLVCTYVRAPVTSSSRQALGRRVLARLNTNQRISKRDLMSADLSIVATEGAKVRDEATRTVSLPCRRGAPPAPCTMLPVAWEKSRATAYFEHRQSLSGWRDYAHRVAFLNETVPHVRRIGYDLCSIPCGLTHAGAGLLSY